MCNTARKGATTEAEGCPYKTASLWGHSPLCLPPLACRNHIAKGLTTALPEFVIAPSVGSPPLREGNRAGLVPPARRGNLKEGERLSLFVKFGGTIGIIPTMQPEFIIAPSVGSPRFARGTKPQGSPCTQGEPEGADKGTAARYRSFGADAIFLGAAAVKRTRSFALTSCVPLSREAGEGERAAPLSHQVGEGLGVRATKNAHPLHAANSSDVPLSDLKEGVFTLTHFCELWRGNWYYPPPNL